MCDTLAIVNEDGVFFAKNSDRDVNEGQVLEWRPTQSFSKDTQCECTWITIPQVAQTHAILISRPFWMWGAEIGTNEHGVCIGNEAVFTNQPYAKKGLLGMDLLRLGLERGASAAAACEVITALLEEHGQGGGCGYEHRDFTYHNSFIVADTREAYVLETAGKHWARESIEGARSISNGLTIPDFAARYSDRIKTTVSACRQRQPRTQALAEKAQSTADCFSILRDYGAGQSGPVYHWLNGAMTAPCMHGGGLVAGNQTAASWVSELKPGDVQHWVTGTSTPSASLFKPVSVHAPVDLGVAPEGVVNDSLWWHHERMARKLFRNPGTHLGEIQQQCAALETQWLDKPPHSAEAFRIHEELLQTWERELLPAQIQDTRPWYVKRFWHSRNRAAGCQ